MTAKTTIDVGIYYINIWRNSFGYPELSRLFLTAAAAKNEGPEGRVKIATFTISEAWEQIE